jgi:hypothetical protein
VSVSRRRANALDLKVYELDSQWDVDTYQDWQRYLKFANG